MLYEMVSSYSKTHMRDIKATGFPGSVLQQQHSYQMSGIQYNLQQR